MDRERLKEVHQSDLTEGRINQDFVDWLQTKGMSYLMIVLVGICVYSAYVYYTRHKTNYQAEAWTELGKASLPSSLEDVAEKYADVGAVSSLARLRAAGGLLGAVQAGKMLGGEGDTPKDLSEADRKDYLDRAEGMFRKVAEADDQSAGKTLIVVAALNGRAAVAESLGNLDQAKAHYAQAAARAESSFPTLAAQARQRAADVGSFAREVTLPTAAQVAALKPPPLLVPEVPTIEDDPATVDPSQFDAAPGADAAPPATTVPAAP